jgi:hypothetical protein
MKCNPWTLGLAASGIIGLASAARAEEAAAPANLLTALPATTLTGYVDTSASLVSGARFVSGGGYTPVNYGSSYNPNYTFESAGNLKRNAISLNVVDLALDRPLDDTEWAAGYHVELWFGPDATALGTSLDSNGDATPAAIRQAYVSLRTPLGGTHVDWKLGVFDTIIGYESLSSMANANFSRSYGFDIEPTTHTGLLGTWAPESWISVQAGVANTSYYRGGYYASITGNALYNPTVMGLITLTAPDSCGWAKGASLSFGAMNTPSKVGTGATSIYAGLSMPTPWQPLKFAATFDYLDEHNAPITGGSDDSIWDAAAYATYQATDKLSLNLRGDYLDNKDASSPGSSTFSLYNYNEAEEVAFDVQYDLWKNVLTRVEFRWDHVGHGKAFVNGANAGGVPDVANAYLLAFQAIYKF